MNGGVNGLWKWVAALIAAVMIGGLPGYIHLYVDSPKKDEIAFIRERQDTVLQRLAAIEVRLNSHEVTDNQLREEIKDLQEDLRAGDGVTSRE